ncbi:phytosulfokine receptor 1-like [Impatiens glandulifera]|uniref:phytosulfokine receptor 1-like n=1 Tax=Impatiens glandulifera TaxID=253017 RepID=UPI001FB073E0|nr:phytosulfokine receptor 1-like [Impatiens glandulifera]
MVNLNLLDLKKLKKFLAGSNMLSGYLPVSLINSPSISTISVNNNSFSGSISAINCSAMASLSYLNLDTNNFVGPIPSDLSLCQRLQVILLSRIKLNSQIPESFKSMKALTVFSVSNSSVYNLSSALSILQHCENLTHLILTTNFMTESMPVDPTLRFDNVKALVIANCGLTGSIPSWLTHSTNLHLLDLSWNRLSGEIPSWFNKMEFIFYLDLSNNSLHGEIPESLTQLRGLTYGQVKDPPIDALPLFLRKNQSLPALQYNRIWSFRPTLDLSHNKLVGQISINFGKLRTLHIFDLSHNMVTGHIPSNLSNMSSLEVLDLSYNSLSGMIPLSLQLLSFLSQFNVAHNNLTGRIPTGGQFLTFPNSSFEGNQGLCNALLTRSCDGSEGNDLNYEIEEEDNELDLESSIFGLQFGIGVIVGFVGAVVGIEKSGEKFFRTKGALDSESKQSDCFLWLSYDLAIDGNRIYWNSCGPNRGATSGALILIQSTRSVKFTHQRYFRLDLKFPHIYLIKNNIGIRARLHKLIELFDAI